MLRFRPHSQSQDAGEILRLWALPDGTRCVLARSQGAFEMQLIRNGAVIRHAACPDPRHARDMGNQWRVDFEMAQPVVTRGVHECPECGDDGEAAASAAYVSCWLRCRSCGHVWLLAEWLR